MVVTYQPKVDLHVAPGCIHEGVRISLLPGVERAERGDDGLRAQREDLLILHRFFGGERPPVCDGGDAILLVA